MTEPVSGRKPVLALLVRLLWAAALVLPAFGAQAAVVLTSLHSFQGLPGACPVPGLVQGSDGMLYGTTSEGGANNAGMVFKISTNGALTSLYSFSGGNDGANPQAGLVQGSDGYFYGTTEGGGTNGSGTVFKVSTNGALTSLYSFDFFFDGAYPHAGLVQGSDGMLYGTTEYAGTNYGGTVFKISTNGALTTLYSFTGGDGWYPQAGLVQGSDGYFYGTTEGGGMYGSAYGGYGTVFKISSIGACTSLYSFTGGNDGGEPQAGLVQGSDGYFYGTTGGGGTNGYGTVFKVSASGALTSLYSFTGGNDGAQPYAGLVQGSDGHFYGTTEGGGTNGNGTVFKVSTTGTLTSLCSFGGNDGAYPSAGLVQGSDGYFYGTTEGGGTNGYGTAFRIGTTGALTSLCSFGVNDGAYPSAGLVQGSDGMLYGTTYNGGKLGGIGFSPHNLTLTGYGTVFQITTNGMLTSLYSFSGSDGRNPQAGLVQGSDGYFYGTTDYGGTARGGTVFKISPTGALATLHSFTGDNDGANPAAGLVQGSDGNLYGTTEFGGPYEDIFPGTVFKISTNGALTTLYSFTGGNDGANTAAGLVQGSDGYFYGTTDYGGTNNAGTVFKISSNGAYTSLYSFTGNNDGGWPNAGLVQGSDGCFYGTTDYGGTNNAGTVFKISGNGALSTLYSFTGGNDGGNTAAGLVQGSDGYFYGTTGGGGTNGYGTVFKISPNGALTSLYSFTGGNDGANPQAGLLQGSDGNFYGTTFHGGAGGAGTVFRLAIVPEFQAVTLTNRTLSLTWSTEAGGRYQVRSNSDVSSSNWTNLRGPVTATGATLITTDSVTNDPRRFYRLVLSP